MYMFGHALLNYWSWIAVTLNVSDDLLCLFDVCSGVYTHLLNKPSLLVPKNTLYIRVQITGIDQKQSCPMCLQPMWSSIWCCSNNVVISLCTMWNQGCVTRWQYGSDIEDGFKPSLVPFYCIFCVHDSGSLIWEELPFELVCWYNGLCCPWRFQRLS